MAIIGKLFRLTLCAASEPELQYVTVRLTVEMPPTRETGRSDPLRSTRVGIRANKHQLPLAQTAPPEEVASSCQPAPKIAAAARRCAQLPTFAPLLEELEVAGWSSHRRVLSGNFHDWVLIQRRTLLVVAGHAGGSESGDPIESALVSQGTWAAIRSHAQHAADAGSLLSLTARSLWPLANAGLPSSVAVALVDLDGGQASVAAAGDCLALKIRAAGSEQIAVNQPAIGADCDLMYPSHAVQLSLRERLVLVADEPARRPAKLVSKIASSFLRLDAESHRRMTAADAVALMKQFYDQQTSDNARPSASVVAVRRR